MQPRQNPTSPVQGAQPNQVPPVRPQSSENLHALQKAIDTMEEKGKDKIKQIFLKFYVLIDYIIIMVMVF